MLRLLPLIMGTILSVGVSFLAAYMIYLFSMKSNAESKIGEEGYIIADILEKHPSPDFTFSGVGSNIMTAYLINNPQATELDLVDLILKDLGNLADNSKRQQIHESFSKYFDDGMPYSGRIYIYSLDKYFRALFPPGMHKKGIGYSYPYSYNKTEDQSKWLFPYGPNGMDQWLREYERIKSAVNWSKRMSGNYYKDLTEYKRLNEDKSFMKRNNYQQWIFQCTQDIEKIETPVRRINSLSKIIEIYSIDKRLPNIQLTGVFFILAFFCGVFLPLLLVGLGVGVEGNVPINLSILFVTVLFTFIAGYYLFKDLSPQKETIQTKVALKELWINLDVIKSSVEHTDIARYTYINNVVKGAYEENIPAEYREKLDSLPNSLSNYNKTVQGLTEIIQSKILDVDILSSNILKEGGGGNVVNITTILRHDDFPKHFEKNMTWVFTLGTDNYSLEYFRIQVPEKDEEYSKFLNEIHKIKSVLLKENEELKNIIEILAIMDELMVSIESEVN